MYKKTKELNVGKELAESYQSPRNLAEILVQKMNRPYFKSNKVHADIKRADVELQLTQNFVLAAMIAMLPMCEYILEKGMEDAELDAAGIDVANAMRLMFYANTSLVRRRRAALARNIDGDMLYPVAHADVSGEFLLGDNVQETVDEVKKDRKLYKDLAPEKQYVDYGRGRARGRGVQRGRGGFNQGQQNQAQHYQNQNQNQGFQHPSVPRGRGHRGVRGRGQQARGGHQQSPLQNLHPQERHNFNKRR